MSDNAPEKAKVDLTDWLRSLQGLDPEVHSKAAALFRKHNVDDAFIAFLASKGGRFILDSYRSKAGRRQRIPTAVRRSEPSGHYFTPVASPARDKVCGASTPVKSKNPPKAVGAGADDSIEYFVGTLKSFNSDSGYGYGFISCEAFEASDVFLHRRDLPSDLSEEQMSPGQCVKFSVVCDSRGRPQARNVSWLAASSEEPPVQPGRRRYVGTLKRAGVDYGFIDCAEADREYGRDVFIARSELQHAGELFPCPLPIVRFDIVVNSMGQPQARNVSWEEAFHSEDVDDIEEDDCEECGNSDDKLANLSDGLMRERDASTVCTNLKVTRW
eukprot:gnl/TRDRNA2_/TRDRNA2_162555_c0_seq1.p1 gnl/TRDRNA2_/TRDRNA2_162555_c0~~gnl/TRDRNA2_/TRDRNA2_162555_c0_seq1.p1  ORF type:complete len:328 (-),score=50.20 gnl/TRDRNA2_/TRDRNA2_162555_c0_seq1:119-1102(-)